MIERTPHPNCPRCHGSGEEPNAQFRCICRWHELNCPAVHTAGKCTCVQHSSASYNEVKLALDAIRRETEEFKDVHHAFFKIYGLATSALARLSHAAEAPPDANPPCARCGGPHPFDTSIPSVRWNEVVRSADWPDYLCLTCIITRFVEAGESFTAELTGEAFDFVPIEIRVRGKVSIDARRISDENTQLRARIVELTNQLEN